MLNTNEPDDAISNHRRILATLLAEFIDDEIARSFAAKLDHVGVCDRLFRMSVQFLVAQQLDCEPEISSVPAKQIVARAREYLAVVLASGGADRGSLDAELEDGMMSAALVERSKIDLSDIFLKQSFARTLSTYRQIERDVIGSSDTENSGVHHV